MIFKKGGSKKPDNKPQSANSSPRRQGAPKPAVRANKPQPNAPKPAVRSNKPQPNAQKPAVQPNRQRPNAPKPADQPNKPQPNIARKPTFPPNKQRLNAAKILRDKTTPKNAKRRKFRGGNYTLYYVLGAIVVIVALVILSNTVLFKCTSIHVSGNEKYTADEVIAASGISTGDNLVRLDVSKARDSIVNSLAYVDDAKVKKSFPTRINITVTEAEKQYCVISDGKTAAISARGKILELCEAGGLPVVKGYDPETLDVGAWLRSKTDGKSDIPADIFAAADKAGLKKITVIDMTDKFNIEVTVEDRVILKLGTSEDIVSKLLVAVEIIENQLGDNESVTLLLTNPEKVPVQNNSMPNTSKPASSSSKSASVSSSKPEEPDDPNEPDDPDDPQDPEDPDPEDPEDPEDPDPYPDDDDPDDGNDPDV